MGNNISVHNDLKCLIYTYDLSQEIQNNLFVFDDFVCKQQTLTDIDGCGCFHLGCFSVVHHGAYHYNCGRKGGILGNSSIRTL